MVARQTLVVIREANFEDPSHRQGLIDVLDHYASEPMGGGVPLSADVRHRLIPALSAQPNALVLLALAGERAVGAATCFFGFSTFHARPLLNIHDLAVMPDFRRRGVAGALLAAAEERARSRDCCKLTLEVRQDNRPARELYHQRGFRDFELSGTSQATLFLSKALTTVL